MTQVDALAAHGDALVEQELALPRSLREASIGADDAMPRKALVRARKHVPDEARRAGIDVAIRADEPNGDRAHPLDDARVA